MNDEMPKPEEVLDDPSIPLETVERILEERHEKRWRKVKAGEFAHAQVEVVDGVPNHQ